MVKATHIGAAALFALALMLPSAASATPPDVYGFGVRSVALGGAVSADVNDPSANYHNPAGLAVNEGIRLSVGYTSLTPQLQINGQRSDVERFGQIQIGMIAPVQLGSSTIAFGLGLVLPDQRLARTRSVIIDRPRWEMYDTRSQRVYLASTLAFRPVDWLSLGIGITFQATSELTLDIEGDLSLLGTVENSRLRHGFEGDLTSIRYLQGGIQLLLHERFRVGVTYRGEYTLTSTINALANTPIVAGGAEAARLRFALRSASTNLFSPQQVSVSTATYPVDGLRIGLELTWYDWSKHPSLISTNTIVLALDPEIVDVPDEISSIPPMDLGLHDVFVPRVSVEYAAVDNEVLGLDLRAGYAYENSPFPTQTGLQNFVDGDKHYISAGFGLHLRDLEPTVPGALTIDGYFLYMRLAERTHQKQLLVDGVGDYVSSGNLFGFGLSAELAFE